jgi:Fe2+ or Zn2+ uptake regulation protein
MQRTVDCGEHLRKSGIKPSFQRMKIFEFLVNNPIHPTVDTIYRALVPDIPTLSKTTVYNTLNLFIEHDITQLITIEDNETRYDADTSIHGHFKCQSCDKVYDFTADSDSLISKGLDGFLIKQQHIYFKGICASCSAALNK